MPRRAEVQYGGGKGQRPDHIGMGKELLPPGSGIGMELVKGEGPVIKKCLLFHLGGGGHGRVPSPGEVMGLRLPVFRVEECLNEARSPRGGPGRTNR